MMPAMIGVSRAGPLESVRELLAAVRDGVAWRHPEWWVLAISAAAWIFMTLPDADPPPGASHVDHLHDTRAALAPLVMMHTRDWMLMIIAMMPPLCIASIRATAVRSL